MLLAASIVTYGAANFLQAVAATRLAPHCTLHPGLLVRLASHKTYVAGVLLQVVGFTLAFLARRDLPLFLVQTAVAAGLGVTVLLGVVVLHWRLPRAEVALLGVLCAGMTALVLSAEQSPSRTLGTGAVTALVAAVPVVAGLGALAATLHGSRGSVALGSLAGLCFGAAAVASRPLAGAPSPEAFLVDPLLYVLLLHAAAGQLLLALAMQRGSTTAAVASMDAAAAVPAAAAGLLLLGDRIAPGREGLAAVGFVVALGAVVGLVRFAEPQGHRRHEARARRAARASYGTQTAGAQPPVLREPNMMTSRSRS